MKVILFLAAVYALIINVSHQKKAVLPLPSPVHQSKPITSDSLQRNNATTVRYTKPATKKQEAILPQFSALSFSW